jgi:hypothetical protein
MWLHVASGVGWEVEDTDMLQCQILVFVCGTLMKEKRNVSVFADILLLQAEQPFSKCFPVTHVFLGAL